MFPRFTAAVLALFLALLFLSSFRAVSQERSAPTRKIVNQVTPRYPDLARKMRLVGTVKLEVIVSLDGKPRSTRILGGSPVLVEAAMDAIQKWRWTPQGVESTEVIEFRFHP